MSNIQVYQIDCKVYLQKDIKFDHILYEISNFIDSGFGKDKHMLEFHQRQGYKNYVHSGFKEIEKDKKYKEGNIYSFSIRCLDEKLKDYLCHTLKDTFNATMKGLATTVRAIVKKTIEKLYSLTPVLIKLDEGYWKGNIDFTSYEKRLIDNAMKKTKFVLGEDFNEDFVLYNRVELLNHKPICSKFKDISFLGDKVELHIAENAMAQQVAYILLGTGVLENNTRGYGFLNYKTVD